MKKLIFITLLIVGCEVDATSTLKTITEDGCFIVTEGSSLYSVDCSQTDVACGDSLTVQCDTQYFLCVGNCP